jgi:hypothetical protein
MCALVRLWVCDVDVVCWALVHEPFVLVQQLCVLCFCVL